MLDRFESQNFFEGFVWGGICALTVIGTACVIAKIQDHKDDIEELFSRLEECEKKT